MAGRVDGANKLFLESVLKKLVWLERGRGRTARSLTVRIQSFNNYKTDIRRDKNIEISPGLSLSAAQVYLIAYQVYAIYCFVYFRSVVYDHSSSSAKEVLRTLGFIDRMCDAQHEAGAT